MPPARPGGLPHLKRRAEFLKVAGAGRKWVAPGLILQVLRREPASVTPSVDVARLPRTAEAEMGGGVRVGFTASRKVGNAVIRNRAKRRLRSAAAEVLPCQGRPGTDYVIVARAATGERAYAALVTDLETALRQLDRHDRGGRPPGGAGRSEEE